jgi:glyoxylase-like metal-dependent hydrolase (beta-lactamase superfamily II)
MRIRPGTTLHQPSRRLILAGGSALLVGAMSALGGRAVLAASAIHKTKIGEAEVTVISDGTFTLPQSLLLPGVDQAALDTLLKAHGASADFTVQTNVCVVRLGSTVALIDTGAGPDFMPTLGRFADRLGEAGIASDSITHVIFTHAHADHFWGVLDPFGDTSLWPKAKHVMALAERDFWLAPDAADKVPEFQKSMSVGIVRRLKALGDVITTAKPGDEIAPGLAFVATPGHTPGHVSVAIRSGTSECLVLGDALTHAAISFGAPSWRWGSDIDGEQAAATRARVLEDAARRKLAVIGYHLPWPGLGRVETSGSAYRFVQEAGK